MMGRSHGVHAEPISFGLKLASWWDEMRRNTPPPDVREGAGGRRQDQRARWARTRRCRRTSRTRSAGASACSSSRSRRRSSTATATRTSSRRSPLIGSTRPLRDRDPPPAADRGAARSRSRSRPARRARRRCRTSATRRSASASRASPACCAATRSRRWRTCRSGTSATSRSRRAERVILADACIVLDYMLDLMTYIVRGMNVYPERMKENMEMSYGLVVLAARAADADREGDEPPGRVQDRAERTR